MASRTYGCIALAPVWNIQGSVWCYDLSKRKIVKRDQLIILPMPAEVVETVNLLKGTFLRKRH